MVWDKIKSMLGVDSKGVAPGATTDIAPSIPALTDRPAADIESVPPPAAPIDDVAWMDAASNPWNVPILDVRPFTLTMMSTSKDPQCASNAVSFGKDVGDAFIDQAPASSRSIPSSLSFSIDRVLADGVLFTPRQMEHKWAIFYRNKKLLFVRSWSRKLMVVAHTEQNGNVLTVTAIHGVFSADDEEAGFTEMVLDFLLRSHALGLPYPAPLPADLEKDTQAAALWCFSAFGNMVQAATPHRIERRLPAVPLRTHSLLHIAVALGDLEKVTALLDGGEAPDILAGDGLAPLHWALLSTDPAIMAHLLERGSPVDVRSVEGATPLMNATQSNNLAAASLLLQHGAAVNAQDLRGFTALHRAAEMGHLDMARLLLGQGASADREAQGHTARSLAQTVGKPEMVALFNRQ